MEFELLCENKLKAMLSAQDMQLLELDYEQMHRSDPATRKALVTILEQAKRESGFDPRGTKLYIEAFPCEEGGCILYFSCIPTAMHTDAYGIDPVLFEFKDSDAMISGACKVFEMYGHRIYKSSLYLFEHMYRMVVYPLDYADRLSIYLLCEYADKLGEGAILAAFTEEHGKELIKDRAIDTIAGHFCPCKINKINSPFKND